MSRLKLVGDSSSNSKLSELYQEIIQCGFGTDKPINWFTSQGLRPDIIEGSWGLVKSILARGELPASLKQMIALSISVQNNCRYCSVVHTHALESMGVPQDEIKNCIKDSDFGQMPPMHRAVLKFCSKAAADPNSITDDDFQNLRECGLNDKEITETVMMVSFTKFINSWADICGLELDIEN